MAIVYLYIEKLNSLIEPNYFGRDKIKNKFFAICTTLRYNEDREI